MHLPTSIKLSVNKKSGGFTLVELMVTIAIIAILASIGLVVYSSVQKTARISKRSQDLQAIKTALELYKSANGRYPTTSAPGLCITTTSALGTLAPTYMPIIPKDPIEDAGGTNCYKYQSNAQEYKVWTTVPSSEMTTNDYKQQPNLVDPARDDANNCVANPDASTITAWAVYSSTGTDAGTNACGY